jgi:hypothetical protein
VEERVVEAIATSWELRVGREGASAAAGGGGGKGGDKKMRQWFGCRCDKTGVIYKRREWPKNCTCKLQLHP